MPSLARISSSAAGSVTGSRGRRTVPPGCPRIAISAFSSLA
jgi:hypothetical protein